MVHPILMIFSTEYRWCEIACLVAFNFNGDFLTVTFKQTYFTYVCSALDFLHPIFCIYGGNASATLMEAIISNSTSVTTTYMKYCINLMDLFLSGPKIA